MSKKDLGPMLDIYYLYLHVLSVPCKLLYEAVMNEAITT